MVTRILAIQINIDFKDVYDSRTINLGKLVNTRVLIVFAGGDKKASIHSRTWYESSQA